MIGFYNGKKRQADELMGKKNNVVYIENILIEQNNNCFLFKKNLKYIWAKFMKTSNMSKESINMLLNNSDLIRKEKYLSCKNIHKIKILLNKLLYGTVI